MTVNFRNQWSGMLLLLGLLGALPAVADEMPVPPPARVAVVDGFLVVHLPEEDATVIAQPATPAETQANGATEDRGWASLSQRGELVWRGQMHDSRGRLYNVRILPGYVVPSREAGDGWSDAGSNLAEYGQAKTWNRLGGDSKDCFRWGWKTSLLDFGLKGSRNAWSERFQNAKGRVKKHTFGWPLAYPWAFVSASFETLIRVPLGITGAALGTASGAVLVPVGYTLWPSVKATSNIAFRGVGLPVCAWTWQTLAATPAFLLTSAPTPARADGHWMKLVDGDRPRPLSPQWEAKALSAPAMDTLARYVGELAGLEAEEHRRIQELSKLQDAELKAVRDRYAPEFTAAREAHTRRLEVWVGEPGNRDAILNLVKEGGDPSSIREARSELTRRLIAGGFSEQDAARLLNRLVSHPLVRKISPAPLLRDKTDPVKGALETADKVLHEPVR